MKFKLKVKTPEDFPSNVDNRVVSVNSTNPANVTLKDFLQNLYDTFGIQSRSPSGSSSLDISFGFPPKTINCSEHESSTLSDIGLSSGSVITLDKKKSDVSNTAQATAMESASTEWQCDACTYLNSNEQSSCEMCGTERKQGRGEEVGGSGSMKRVVVDSDNSCLFRIVGYLLENKSMDKVSKLRQIVAVSVENRKAIQIINVASEHLRFKNYTGYYF
eukprot:gb/GECG01004326.1/.p1 GENE.gb/GECG01004326.1/~~gb/GECG01004326.1/.p1  ORF type:complete len:218 (+),score=29.63 gb/GECG01004326.1/:1-654(+)